MNTTFVKWDNSRIVYPNALLSANLLINVTRSGNKVEVFKVRSSSTRPKHKQASHPCSCTGLAVRHELTMF